MPAAFLLVPHTIKPVLLYGSEIWGIFSAEKLNKFRDSYFNQLCSNLIAERLHVKFCKLTKFKVSLKTFLIKLLFRLSKTTSVTIHNSKVCIFSYVLYGDMFESSVVKPKDKLN
jgi:hypothetical protein